MYLLKSPIGVTNHFHPFKFGQIKWSAYYRVYDIIQPHFSYTGKSTYNHFPPRHGSNIPRLGKGIIPTNPFILSLLMCHIFNAISVPNHTFNTYKIIKTRRFTHYKHIKQVNIILVKKCNNLPCMQITTILSQNRFP